MALEHPQSTSISSHASSRFLLVLTHFVSRKAGNIYTKSVEPGGMELNIEVAFGEWPECLECSGRCRLWDFEDTSSGSSTATSNICQECDYRGQDLPDD
jgi:hypothetical protein